MKLKNRKAAGKIRGKYLRVTEQSNALDYLERATEFIGRVDRDPMAWKWVVLSLHGALYAYCICALQGTNPDVVKEKRGKNDHLIGFNEAIRWCQTGVKIYPWGQCKPLVLSESQTESLHTLKDVLRNKFEHYSPTRWSIEIHGLPRVSMDILDIVHFLVFESGSWMHLEPNRIKRIRTLLNRARITLSKNKLHRELLALEAAKGKSRQG